MASPLLARLSERPLLADGAMGTVLYARGVPVDACFEVLNLRNPELVRTIHADYIAAGADLIETNTFGANRFKLGIHGLDDRVREINRQGAKWARDVREAMGRDVFVLGSVGPLGKYLEPMGGVSADDARQAFRQQAEGLLEGGVDGFILETFSDPEELRLAIEAVRAVSADLPILAQMTFSDDGVTFLGHSPREVARTLRELPVQVIGANCSVGPSVLHDVIEEMAPEAGGLVLSVQPNAGLPSRVGDRLIYLASPAYFAGYATRLLERGARIVGGCCGTSPEHIRAMREVLDRHVPEASRPRGATVVAPRVEVPLARSEAEPTLLARKLAAREFVVTVELDPPRGPQVEKLLQVATSLRSKGVEIVDINDGSLGRVRMAAAHTALLVQRATGLDINLHFTCRDRNLMGMQGELLGAHALGIRNILAMTGDPPRAGDYVNTTAVFDVDAIGLVRIIAGFNRGVDASGTAMGISCGFAIGVALDPGAEDLEREVARFHGKIEAGAEWAQTQPIYDLEVLERFFAKAGPSPIPIIVGILPLHSSRHAEFLHNEVPGITVPLGIRQRMKEAGEKGLSVGIQLAQETLRSVRKRYQGVYLMPSFGRAEAVTEVLDALE